MAGTQSKAHLNNQRRFFKKIQRNKRKKEPNSSYPSSIQDSHSYITKGSINAKFKDLEDMGIVFDN